MTDTDAKIEKLQREMIQRLTPTQRAQMGSSMFDTARELMECGFRSRDPHLDRESMRPLIFKALYGKDFEESHRKKIEAWLFGQPQPVVS